MGKLIQTSKVKISKEPGKNKIKRAEIEGFPGAVRMGIHGGIAQYFKLSPEEPMASTLDYIVAAVGGCMTGTVAGALEARGVSANPDSFKSKPRAASRGRRQDDPDGHQTSLPLESSCGQAGHS